MSRAEDGPGRLSQKVCGRTVQMTILRWKGGNIVIIKQHLYARTTRGRKGSPSPPSGGGGGGTRPWWLALLACGGAYWPLALEPSAMTSRHPYYCGHPHCCGHPPAPGWESRMQLGGGGTCTFPNIRGNPDKPTHPPSDPPPRYRINWQLSKRLLVGAPTTRANTAVLRGLLKGKCSEKENGALGPTEALCRALLAQGAALAQLGTGGTAAPLLIPSHRLSRASPPHLPPRLRQSLCGPGMHFHCAVHVHNTATAPSAAASSSTTLGAHAPLPPASAAPSCTARTFTVKATGGGPTVS